MINIKKFNNELISGFSLKLQQRIMLAVSGGADSMCMALLMQKCGFDISCLIVDHGLRAESSAEAIAVKEILNSYDVHAVILKWLDYDPDLHLANLHHQAREARYRLLLDYCQKHHINYLAVAHNKNDQAENVLLRIGRGTGIDGLALMKSSQKIGNCQVIRPLIHYYRQEIEETLKYFNWHWFKDPANYNDRFARTRVRLLLEHNDCSLTTERLYLLAKNATRVSDYLKKVTLEAVSKVALYHPLAYFILSIEEFLTYHEEIQLRILAYILRAIGGRHGIRLVNLEKLLNKIKDFCNWRDTTFHDCQILKAKQNHNLLFIKENQAIQKQLMLPCDQEIIWDNRFIIRKEKITEEKSAEGKLSGRKINEGEIIIEALSLEYLAAIKDKIDSSIILEHHKIKWTLPVMICKHKVIACPALGWVGDEMKFNYESL